MLAAKVGPDTAEHFGSRDEVDPIQHLLFTAAGWGGNPREAAVYTAVLPKPNDGKSVLKLTVRDVPVEAFWSISVYNARGFLEKNSLESYSLNNLTAEPNNDGSYTIQLHTTNGQLPRHAAGMDTCRVSTDRSLQTCLLWQTPRDATPRTLTQHPELLNIRGMPGARRT